MIASKVPAPLRRDRQSREPSVSATPPAESLRRDTRTTDNKPSQTAKSKPARER